jgi:hypothetical protein
MKRTIYRLDQAPERPAPAHIDDPLVVRAKANLDFHRWQHHARTRANAKSDELLLAIARGLRQLKPTLSNESISFLYHGAMLAWFDFLDASMRPCRSVRQVSDIDRPLLQVYVSWLRTRKPALTSAK